MDPLQEAKKLYERFNDPSYISYIKMINKTEIDNEIIQFAQKTIALDNGEKRILVTLPTYGHVKKEIAVMEKNIDLLEIQYISSNNEEDGKTLQKYILNLYTLYFYVSLFTTYLEKDIEKLKEQIKKSIEQEDKKELEKELEIQENKFENLPLSVFYIKTLPVISEDEFFRKDKQKSKKTKKNLTKSKNTEPTSNNIKLKDEGKKTKLNIVKSKDKTEKMIKNNSDDVEEQTNYKSQADKIKKKAVDRIVNSYPLNLFPFKTRDECTSSARTKHYYLSKEDLVKRIDENPDLKNKFPPKFKTMPKADLCNIIFSLKS